MEVDPPRRAFATRDKLLKLDPSKVIQDIYLPFYPPMFQRFFYLIASLWTVFLLSACMKQTPPPVDSNSADTRLRDAVPAAVIVILTEHPDPKSDIITLQNYFRDGRSFIPIFRSQESFDQSTRGHVNKPTYRIDRGMLIAMLHGPETVILDPSLPDEMVTTADQLKRAFPRTPSTPGSKPK